MNSTIGAESRSPLFSDPPNERRLGRRQGGRRALATFPQLISLAYFFFCYTLLAHTWQGGINALHMYVHTYATKACHIGGSLDLHPRFESRVCIYFLLSMSKSLSFVVMQK
jgi:hypothetical protein